MRFVLSYTIGRDDKVILSDANVNNSKGEHYGPHDDAQIQQKFPGKPTKHGSRTLAERAYVCLLYTSPSPRDVEESRMPSSA